MKNLIIPALILGISLAFVSAAEQSVKWPDYSAWTVVVQDYPFVVSPRDPNKESGNDYMNVLVQIGVISMRVDNTELALKMVVVEFDVLGNGPVIRNLAREMTTKREIKVLDTQILINGKWVSVKEGSLRVYADNPEALLEKGELASLLLVVKSLNPEEPPIELRLENKLKRP